jgi:hypothetical protein
VRSKNNGKKNSMTHRLGIQRGLARRQQLDAIQFVQRALSVRIEAPDAVHVAIQHIDPVGCVRAHRKDVDQRTADGELAMCDDLRDGRVAGQRQLGAQRFQIQGFADMDLERVGLDEASRRQSLQQSVDGDQPDALARARQFRQGGEPRGGDIGMRGEAVVGQGFQIGKDSDIQGRAGKEANLIAQGLRVARILRDDDERPLRGRRRFRNGERRGGAVELAPFDDGRVGLWQIRSE